MMYGESFFGGHASLSAPLSRRRLSLGIAHGKAAMYFGLIILAASVILTQRVWPWSSLLLLPLLYYGSHALYTDRRGQEKQRAEESAQFHRRMIDLLALAMEAKNRTTHAHLRRVEVYAIAVGQELGLDKIELEALRASAVLHDIGKLAVPEYIISKPGKLTPAEFEKVKVHTVVGAEIVEQIGLPYPAAPIVRSHHERWDGKGYPDGLSGEQIPLGARILAAVDCLDALASDRQYRRALPLREAIAIVKSEAGKAFDPRVVTVLVRRYLELERVATAGSSCEQARLSIDVKIARGDAPAAGFESTSGLRATSDLINFQKSVAGEDLLGGRMNRQAALSTFLASVRNIVPCDLLVIYRRSGGNLIPESLDGAGYRTFASLEIPLGIGLSGWVAENARPIVNGNPAVEPGYLKEPAKFKTLRSALAVPLEAHGSVVGVLSLYRTEYEAFASEDLARLLPMSSAAAGVFDLWEQADLQCA
jgi:putative nucleotidyltransferase with HDIG domain